MSKEPARRATNDDRYDRETITIMATVDIEWAKGSEACRQDAIKRAVELHLICHGASQNGGYSAVLTSAKHVP